MIPMKKILLKTDQKHPVIQAYKHAVEKGKNNQHVIPQGDKWLVRRLGPVETTHLFTTQIEAEKFAEALVQSQGTAVFVHSSDGRIKDRKDYSLNQ